MFGTFAVPVNLRLENISPALQDLVYHKIPNHCSYNSPAGHHIEAFPWVDEALAIFEMVSLLFGVLRNGPQD